MWQERAETTGFIDEILLIDSRTNRRQVCRAECSSFYHIRAINGYLQHISLKLHQKIIVCGTPIHTQSLQFDARILLHGFQNIAGLVSQ